MDKEDEESEKLERCIENAADALAKQASEQTAGLKVPLPPEAHQEKLRQEYKKNLQTVLKKLQDGMVSLLTYLIELSKNEPDAMTVEISKNISQMAAIAAVLTERIDDFLALLTADMTFQEIFALTNETLESLYRSAKYIYEHQNYQEAASAFAVLTIINPTHYIFWIGLGNSEYFCQNYEAALIAYAMAAQADPFDPLCHIFSSKCYEEIKDKTLAINALDLAILTMGDNPTYAELKKKVQESKNRLNK